MKMQAAELVGLIMQAADTTCLPVHARSYSGRGMYGGSCVGVVVDSIGELFVLAIAIGNTANSGDQLDTLMDMAPETDHLGRGIIAYWPMVEWDKSVVVEVEREDEDHGGE